MSTEHPDAGPSSANGNAAGSSQAQGTLAAMWSKPAIAPPPTEPSAPTWATDSVNGLDHSAAPPPPTLAPPAANRAPSASQPRKRKKKEEKGPPQGKLVFGANGVGYGAPSPPPAASDTEEKKNAKTKGKRKSAAADANGEEGSKKRRGKASAIGTTASQSLLSSDTASEAAEDPQSGSEIEVLGEGRHKGSGSSRDPVRLDESPKLPKKIVFASDQKATTHSFFARPLDSATSRLGISAPVEAQAESGNGVAPAKKPVHNFFATAGKAEAGSTKKGWGCCKEGDEPMAPLPYGDWAAHIGARFDGGKISTPHRQFRLRADDDAAFWQHYLSEPTRSPPPPHILSEPTPAASPDLDHPAIAAVARSPHDPQQSWCDQHRPREAAAVLGNEVEASYLRDWLKALSVGGIDSKRVIRRVHRRKAVNPGLSWIVDDAGLFGDPFGDAMYEDDEIPEPVEEPLLPLGARPDSYPPIGNWVSNTILLSGPSGTGKSAAVHAAATELGWEVFEVYPGIGKRTGTNLLSLVGDVGRNHTVTREKKSALNKKAPATNTLKSMFNLTPRASSQPTPPPKASQGSAADPIELDNEAPAAPLTSGIREAFAPAAAAVQNGCVDSNDAVAPNASDAPEIKAQQSLILIDEADILFEEESSFWPALVSLIADSRRPVVITCNDISRIPLQTLPLQTILHFHPASIPLARAYLSAIAKHHGVEDAVPKHLRQQPYHCDLVDQPLPPSGNEPMETFDLRAAITQMQLDRGSVPEKGPEDIRELSSLALRLENMSFADAFVSQRDWGRLEMAEIDRYNPTHDDEEAPHQLLKPFTQDLHPVLAVCDHSDDIADTLVALSGGAVSFNNVQYAQTKYIRRVLPLLDELVFLSGRLLPHPSLFLELIPFTRTVVHADDVLVVEDSQATDVGAPRINRRTGRLMRTGRYERWLDLPDELLDIARYGGLEWTNS